MGTLYPGTYEACHPSLLSIQTMKLILCQICFKHCLDVLWEVLGPKSQTFIPEANPAHCLLKILQFIGEMVPINKYILVFKTLLHLFWE